MQSQLRERRAGELVELVGERWVGSGIHETFAQNGLAESTSVKPEHGAPIALQEQASDASAATAAKALSILVTLAVYG